ncbi:MAG: hypothetical protein ETSY2_04920 [Candidatus Entotheonella gemina]|uniref:Uncharacterized protein n=1 Tax=Candidatus Entotheonella gemina TaxID=1429439 RepID=W4MDU6_9BACT|nr:MAG: hypothetical protein ETSY2_04920 [Candidatus Entotheonella gemina]
MMFIVGFVLLGVLFPMTVLAAGGVGFTDIAAGRYAITYGVERGCIQSSQARSG